MPFLDDPVGRQLSAGEARFLVDAAAEDDLLGEVDVAHCARVRVAHDLFCRFVLAAGDGLTVLAARDLERGYLVTLPPHTASLLENYEAQADPESRFVRAVDKLMPVVVERNTGRPSSIALMRACARCCGGPNAPNQPSFEGLKM